MGVFYLYVLVGKPTTLLKLIISSLNELLGTGDISFFFMFLKTSDIEDDREFDLGYRAYLF